MKPKTLLFKKVGKVSVALLFEVRDLWVGVYWTKESEVSSRPVRWQIYIGVIPMLPIQICTYVI